MKFALKILAIAVVLAGLFLFTFLAWGEQFERWFSARAMAAWFAESRPWAWMAGIGLLLVDLVLPVPATGVMSALGSVYGVAVGALVGAAGSASAGLVGYGLARLGGRRAAGWIASEEELDRFRDLFDRWGGYAVIASRILPILPEVVAVLAGFARMRPRRFVAALLLGTVPTATLFAWLGHVSRAEPWWGFLAATLAPLAVWPVFVRLAMKRQAPGKPGR